MEFYYDTIKVYNDEIKRLVSSVTGRFISSVLAGIIGSIILMLFCSLLVAENNMLSFVPWILAFNTATYGYSFLIKCEKRQSCKMIYAVCIGLLIVVLACLFFNYFFWHTGTTITAYRGVVFLAIGFIASGCGGWLAVKNHDYHKEV